MTNIYTPHWQVFLITEPWTPLTSDMDSTMAQQFSANHWYVWGGDGWKSYLNSLLWHVSCVTLWTRSASNLKWGSWRGFLIFHNELPLCRSEFDNATYYQYLPYGCGENRLHFNIKYHIFLCFFSQINQKCHKKFPLNRIITVTCTLHYYV